MQKWYNTSLQSNMADCLTCAMCKEHVEDPKGFNNCSHKFCNGCYKKHTKSKEYENGLMCPSCIKQVEPSETSVHEIQKSTFWWYTQDQRPVHWWRNWNINMSNSQSQSSARYLLWNGKYCRLPKMYRRKLSWIVRPWTFSSERAFQAGERIPSGTSTMYWWETERFESVRGKYSSKRLLMWKVAKNKPKKKLRPLQLTWLNTSKKWKISF